MKTNKIIIASLMALGLFFAACEETAPLRELPEAETNEIQAYFLNATDVTIRPASGDSVSINCAVGSYKSDKLTFPVLVGRNITDEAAVFDVIVLDTKKNFELETTVTFEIGQNIDTIWVTPNLGFGQSAKLSMMIPDSLTTLYGNAALALNVVVDYTWVSAGQVMLESGWEGTSGVVNIEHAKEFTDKEGNSLYRLVSPFYIVAPDFCTVPGLHLQFLLDKDYNAVDLYTGGSSFVQVENTGYNWIYWDTKNFGAYESFYNEGNVYYLSALWNDGSSSLYGPATEKWTWVKGYPGEVEEQDPTEGDGKLQNIEFTVATAPTPVDVTHEVLDELLYSVDYEVFPESYKEHMLFVMSFANKTGATMGLTLVGDSVTGTYTLGDYSVNEDGIMLAKSGLAIKGEIVEEQNVGCWIDLTWNKFYLQAGTVKITNEGDVYTVKVDAVSATGSKVTASFEGTFVSIANALQGRKNATAIAHI